MKAALLHNYDTSLTSSEYVKLEEVPEPKILNDTDVIVRIGGAGVCRTVTSLGTVAKYASRPST